MLYQFELGFTIRLDIDDVDPIRFDWVSNLSNTTDAPYTTGNYRGTDDGSGYWDYASCGRICWNLASVGNP